MRDAASTGGPILVLGTAEWNAEVATNQHYVVRELAQWFDTHFVESLGLRRVRLDRRDLGRMAGRLRSALADGVRASRRPIPTRARVISPIVVPIHRRATRLVNTALLTCAVSAWRAMPGPKILWTFTPVTYGLERYADFVLYHCVDILAAFPGVDATAVRDGERNLAARAHLAIGTSRGVAAHLGAAGFAEILTLPNVADVDTFAAASRPAARRRAAAIFAGNLSPYKLDVRLLRDLAVVLRDRGELLLAGPIAAGGGDFADQLAELERLGARYLGVLSVDQLAEVMGGCAVGLIPYALNDYTAGVSPLKCYEYLAAGLGVVSTAIPEVAQAARRTDLIVVAPSTEEFVNSVACSIGTMSDSVVDARRRYAADFGWTGRGELIRGIAAAQMPATARRAAGRHRRETVG